MKTPGKINLYALISAIISFVFYLKTLCPTVYLGDSGELCAAAYTLSIAHPPGYPLYTLIGWLFGHLPFGSVAFLLNLEAAIFSAISVYLVYLILEKLINGFKSSVEPPFDKILTVIGSLIWGFSNTLWGNSVGAEVYSLSIALSIGLIYLFIRYFDSPSPKLLIFIFYLFGLAMGNHFSVVALVSLMILLLFWPKFNLRNVMFALIAAAAAITLYLYIPLRSLNYPPIDWAHPVTWKAFIEHVSAARFQGFFAQMSIANLALNLKHFIIIIHNEFPMAWLGLLGIVAFAWKKPRIGLPLFIAMIINIGYASMYEIPDIEPHFLITIFLSAIGLIYLVLIAIEYVGKMIGLRAISFVSCAILILILTFETAANFKLNDQSDNRLGETYGSLILKSIPHNSLLISVGWTAGAPCIYLHEVEKVAPDIKLFDPISMASNLAKHLGKQDSLGMIPELHLAIRALNNWPGDKFLGKDHLWGGDNPFKYAQYPLQGDGLVYRYGKRTRADLVVWQNMTLPKADTANHNLGFNDRVALSNIFLSWGEDLLSNGMIQESREKFTIAAGFTESLADPFIPNAMGIFFRRLNMFDLAKHEYEKALDAPFVSNKVRADINVNIGNLFRDKRDYESAKGRYLEALKLRTGHSEAEYNLAVTEAYINLNNKNYRAAIDNFLAAVRLDPADPMLYYNVGLIYDSHLNEPDNAIIYYNEYLRRAGDTGMTSLSLQGRIAQLSAGQK
jgi:tetratricopeptide (TPR) repeat protein